VLALWALVILQVVQQKELSKSAKTVWIGFLVVVPVLSWMAYGIWRVLRRLR
jgi:Phospholipase_D-nuclease N-terminal